MDFSNSRAECYYSWSFWAVLGVAAFIMSLVCFSKKGTTSGQKVIGLLLAVFLGPFYWIYYAGSGSYCKSAQMSP
jgi:hypothetical protein